MAELQVRCIGTGSKIRGFGDEFTCRHDRTDPSRQSASSPSGGREGAGGSDQGSGPGSEDPGSSFCSRNFCITGPYSKDPGIIGSGSICP